MDIDKIRTNQLTEDEKMEIIADYLENSGGGRDIVDLTPYFDSQTFTLDVEEVAPMVEEGNHIYTLTISYIGGSTAMCFSGARIENEKILFAGIPVVSQSGSNGTIESYNLAFDSTTGALDQSSLASSTPIYFKVSQNNNLQNVGVLQINANGHTYNYDGSANVIIDL